MKDVSKERKSKRKLQEMLLKNNELPLNKDLSSCNVDIPTTFSLIIKGFIFQFRFKTKESQLRKINFIFFNESLIISDTP